MNLADYTVISVIVLAIQAVQTLGLEYLRRRYPGRTDVFEHPPAWSLRPPPATDDRDTYPDPFPPERPSRRRK